jgi:hypothetical protein
MDIIINNFPIWSVVDRGALVGFKTNPIKLVLADSPLIKDAA